MGDNGHPSATLAVPGAWYVAALARDLRGHRPVARVVGGTPMALFRDAAGRPHALLDRCPHRNVPLSYGSVRDGVLECCYHGWQFDGDGTCRAIPGLVGEPDRRARHAGAYPTVESDGFVWVQPVPGDSGDDPGPFRFPHVGDHGYTTVRRHARFEAGLHAALENTLDVPHTAFLHGGLFRGGRDPVEIDVIVRNTPTGAEAEYVGEPRPEGLAGRILAPEGGVVTHVDRFLLPSIAEVEYRLGVNHLLVTSAFTPVSEFETDLHAAITFRLRLPHALVRAAITPIANRIVGQDAAVLRRQTEAVRRFGGEHFASTELDVLGQHIRKLLRQAARGEAPDPDIERRLRMRV
ncbi:MAG: Rieske 2Fe-2S domain-containing protein [Acidimicrobiales bacterium]